MPAAKSKNPDKTPVSSVDDIDLTLSVKLGTARITLGDALGYEDNSTIALDRTVTDTVDLLLNGVLFARGEVVTIGGDFGVRVVEVIGQAAGEER